MSRQINTIIEKQVISYMLRTQDMSILDRNGIVADDFTGKEIDIVKYMVSHRQRYQEVPNETTIIAHFGEDYTPVQSSESPLYLEDEITAHFKMKYFASNAPKLFEQLQYGTAIERNEALIQIGTLANEATRTTSARGSGVNILKDTTRVQDYYQRASGKEQVLLTGIKGLDDALLGILADDTVIIMGRPGSGKSFFSTYLASQFANQGKNVAIYSGEMEVSHVGYRFDAIQAGVSNSALISGRELQQRGISMEEYKDYLNKNATRENYVRVLTNHDFGGRPTVGDLTTFVDNFKPDVLIIDQLSLMRDSTSGVRDERIKFLNIMRDLRTLSADKRIPIIILSQANREATEKEDDGTYKLPEIHHLAESDAVAQYATRAISLAGSPSSDGKSQILKVGIKKNRHGNFNEFKLLASYDIGQFEEYDPDSFQMETGQLEVPF